MPAANMTYTTLVDSVPGYLERSNDALLTDELPRLVMLAEQTIAADLKTLGVQSVLQATMTATDPVIEKPQYWRDTVSLNFTIPSTGEVKTLQLRTYEFCRAYAPIVTDTAEPVYYADYDYSNFFVAPAPDLAYDFEMLYHPRLTPLSVESQTNWLTDNAPQLLLARVLLEAETWLKNYERAAVWEKTYTAALASLTGEDNRRVVDRTGAVR